MQDSEIIDLFFSRDEDALEVVRQKYGGLVKSTAMNILTNREDSEEVLNDTLLRVWHSIPPHRPSFLNAFLTKIARNLALDKWRAKNAARRGQGDVPFLLSELNEVAGEELQDTLDYQQTAAAISEYLHTLPKQARTAFVQRYFYGLSYPAIAREQGISEGAVRSLLFRTRKKLKTHLEDKGVIQ